MRVVEDDEAERLIKSGVWFDSPALAKEYKVDVVKDIKNEEAEKKKPAKSKAKTKEQSK